MEDEKTFITSFFSRFLETAALTKLSLGKPTIKNVATSVFVKTLNSK